MNDTKLGWTAGIIDGEGTIGIAISRANRKPTGYRLNVRVGNTDIRMLNALQRLWGGSIATSRQNSKHGYRDFYVWSLISLDAQRMLKMVAPHIVTKRAQAQVAIRLQRRIKGRFGHKILIDRTGWRPKFQGAKITPSEWKARHALYLQMKSLNERRIVRSNGCPKPPPLCPGNRVAA